MQAARYQSFLILFALLLSSVLAGYRIHLHQSGRSIIDGDGKGYYAYLIEWHNKIFGTTQSIQSNTAVEIPPYVVRCGQVYYNKYPPGTAFCMLPAFATATIFQQLSGEEFNPYADLFQLAITINGWLFLLAGCIFVFRTLQILYTDSGIAVLTIICIVFGTNLIFYAVDEPAMSHIYAFALISGFVFAILHFQKAGQIHYVYLAIFFFSMAVCIRYFHFLLLLTLPYLLKKNGLKNFGLHVRTIPLLLLATLPIISVIASNVLQTGMILPPSYPGEGFYFFQPRFADSLLSFRKGLFTWFPLLIPAFAGFFFRENRKILPWLIVSIYLLSAWWNWYFGDGFGLRPYCDYMVFFSIGLQAVIVRLQSRVILLRLFVGICFVFILWNTLLSWQYLQGIIPPDGMNAEKAVFVFGKTHKKYAGLVRGETQEIFGYPAPPVFSYSDSSTCVFDSQTVYGKSIDYVLADELTDGNRYLASIHALYREKNYMSACGSLFTLSIFDPSGKTIFWSNGFVTPLPRQAGRWCEGSYAVILPEKIPSGARIRFVIWNEKAENFSIKNVSCEIRRYALQNNGRP